MKTAIIIIFSLTLLQKVYTQSTGVRDGIPENKVSNYLSNDLTLKLRVINISTNQSVRIDWKVGKENTGYFTLERSGNGFDWEKVTEIKRPLDRMNSSIETYNTIDRNPHTGISYYRIKQTNSMGQLKYSKKESVHIEPKISTQIRLSSGPRENTVNLEGVVSELNSIRVFNVVGKDVTHIARITDIHHEKVAIDLSPLTKGMYLIKTKNTIHKVFRR